MSFDGGRSLLPINMEVKPSTAVELWQLRLRPTSNKQMTTILTTFIVVSGLLTTSTYPATYTSAIPRDQTGGKLLTQANLYAWFRLVNGISFLLSVATIFGSCLLILELQRHASAKDGARPDMFRREFAQRLLRVYTTVSYSLLLSLLVAALAVSISSIAFERIATACISLAFVGLTIAICCWFYWSTQGYTEKAVLRDPGAEYVNGPIKSLVYTNPMVHV